VSLDAGERDTHECLEPLTQLLNTSQVTEFESNRINRVSVNCEVGAISMRRVRLGEKSVRQAAERSRFIRTLGKLTFELSLLVIRLN
jgi:hypothetical protein